MRIKALTALLTIFIFFAGGVLYPVLAAEVKYESGKKLVEYTEDVNDDLYISGDESVVVEGNVDGDLFVGGGTIDVEGDVTGTVYTAGGVITIDGKVDGSIFATGGEIIVSGEVMRTVYAAGGTLTIEGDVKEDAMVTGGRITISSNVGDDVRAAGGFIKVEGNVGDDLMVGGGQVDIRGNISGDALIAGDSVVIRSDEIGGDLVIYGEERQVELSEKTEIGGEYRFEEPKFQTKEEVVMPDFGLGLLGLSGFAFFFRIIFTFVQALGLILLGWLVSKFAPVKLEATLMKMNSWGDSGRSLALGFVAIPTGIFLAIFLAVSGIGWPTLSVLVALFTIASTLVVPIVGLSLGRWILDQFEAKTSVVLPLFIGVFLIQLIRLIPILGSLVYSIVFLVGIGAMLRMQYEKFKAANKAK